jgi:hypothetical protein
MLQEESAIEHVATTMTSYHDLLDSTLCTYETMPNALVSFLLASIDPARSNVILAVGRAAAYAKAAPAHGRCWQAGAEGAPSRSTRGARRSAGRGAVPPATGHQRRSSGKSRAISSLPNSSVISDVKWQYLFF